MGWWSADIMGGDTPLDIKSDIEGFFGVYDRRTGDGLEFDDLNSEKWTKVREVLNRYPGKVMVDLGNQVESKYSGNDKNIVYQVMAVIWMASGAMMSAVIKNFLVNQIREDAWAKEGDEERQRKIHELAKGVLDYAPLKNGPTLISSKGLFEVMADKICGPEEEEFKGGPAFVDGSKIVPSAPPDPIKQLMVEALEKYRLRTVRYRWGTGAFKKETGVAGVLDEVPELTGMLAHFDVRSLHLVVKKDDTFGVFDLMVG